METQVASVCKKCDKQSSSEKRFPRCSACKQVRYCSKECQRLDWKKHRPECKFLRPYQPKRTAVLIKSGERDHVYSFHEIDFGTDDVTDILGTTTVDNCTLLGLMHEGRSLGMFMWDSWTRTRNNMNPTATLIRTTLTDICFVLPSSTTEVFHDVLLFDDNGSINEKDLDHIIAMCYRKKNGNPPEALKQYIKERKRDAEECQLKATQDPDLISFAKLKMTMLPDINTYGKLKY